MPKTPPHPDEVRQRILNGAETQLVVSSRRWYSAGVISYRTCLEVRLRTDADRWPRREDVLIVGNPEEGSDNPLDVTGILHRWLSAVPSTPPADIPVEATV